MLKNTVKYSILGSLLLFLLAIIWQVPAVGTANNYSSRESILKSFYQPQDTINDSIDLRYPFNDNASNPLGNSSGASGLYLRNPSNIQTDVEYDPINREYTFTQQIGGRNYRTPYTMSADEYSSYRFNRAMQQHWRERTQSTAMESPTRRFNIPQLNIGGEVFGNIFGSNTINIVPQGSAELIFGANISNIENPALPQRLQRQTTFDFDMKIQMGVNGQIGDKINLGINYNTEASFDFENQTKLAYEGEEDDIIQLIEAGNVSLPLSGSLITGSQSLFGFKTALKFGNLTATSIFSQQKSETKVIEIENGAQVNDFEVTVDDYEANKHFFVAQYFRDTYDDALSTLPIMKSGITITRMEVWITNKNQEVENTRNVLAMMDLGEGLAVDPNNPDNVNGPTNIYATQFVTSTRQVYPNNEANDLYRNMINNYSSVRNAAQITSVLAPLENSHNYVSGRDYEKIENARLLSTSEYTFHQNLGYISLNYALNADEILAVAFEYRDSKGNIYKVGEFTTDVKNSSDVIMTKLLKGTNLTPKLPTWKLMMKNVYAIGAYQISPENFILNVYYKNDKTGSEINYLPDGELKGANLLRVLNLDEVNAQLDPYPDGRFDYIEGTTVYSSNGRIFFPVLEPFGSFLREKINDDALADRYVFEELYDSTQYKAQQIAEKNKFVLKGSYESSTGSEIMLNAMNIPEGSVKVTANGAALTEGTDYLVDYNLGRVNILNQGLLESGTPIQISLENNSMFNTQRKTMIGTHLDYKISENFNIGGTVLNLSEKPMTSKVNFGDESISNTIWGLNTNYSTESQFLTTLVDKIPLIQTKAPSSITFEGEFAQLIPGHSRALEKEGISYIDDFEASKITIDIKTQSAWKIASTPQGQPHVFPEGNLTDTLPYGYNRAKFCWYNVISDFQRTNASAAPDHLRDDPDQMANHLVREVFEQDIFPNRQSQNGYPTSLSVLNLAYYPNQKGPYNFDVEPNKYSAGIDENGFLNAPESRWAGIMRRLQTNDFESANIEFIEFWMMDPFVYDTTHTGGDLYFNLGNISEDVLKDSRKSFENGLPSSPEIKQVDTTAWGRVPTVQSLVNAFDNNPAARPYQDVGFDGLSDNEEIQFFSNYLERIKAEYGENSRAYQKALQDPSNDNYHFFKGTNYDAQQKSILERYKLYNGMERNSPTDAQNPESYPISGTLLPDIEDINLDNTLSESESYYQYRVSIRPQDMIIGKNYITDIIVDDGKRANKKESPVKWYQFKVPIYAPDEVIGSIEDYKSIRFIRLFMNNFSDSVVLRFAELNLVRGEWRKYNFDLAQGMEDITNQQPTSSNFDISAVNIEENTEKEPVNYVLPPDVNRQIDPMNPQLRELNEQAMTMKVIDLNDGEAVASYRNTDLDLRQYGRLQMYIHAEAIEDGALLDGQVAAIVRLGSDYKENYYEVEIPLNLTPPGRYDYQSDDEQHPDRYIVWPQANNLNIPFAALQDLKQERDILARQEGSTVDPTMPYEKIYTGNGQEQIIRIVGYPTLSEVRTIMLGVRNPSVSGNKLDPNDDGLPKSVEVWMNELRLTDFIEDGGWAANARLSTRLADFATVNMSGHISTPGFGSIEKKVNERSKEEIIQYDLSSNVELGSFFPKKMGVKIPMYAGYSEGFINPQYDPSSPDIILQDRLSNPELSKQEKDSIRHFAQDYTRRKSLNFTNIKIDPQSSGDNAAKGKPFYHVSNFSTSFAYSEIYKRNIDTEHDILRTHTGGFNYLYSMRPKNVAPFRRTKSKLIRSPYMKLIKDFNFYYLPSQISFRTDMQRQYNEILYRNVTDPTDNMGFDPIYKKDFMWNRLYDMKFDLSRSLKFDFSATNVARIDEPYGRLDKDSPGYEAKMDTLWDNIYRIRPGRTTDYDHRLNISYNIPIDKVPLMRWVRSNIRYSGTYNWQAGPILADPTINLGNTIQNSNSIQFSTQFNMKTVYKNVDYLKKVERRVNKRARKNPNAKPQMKTAKRQIKGKDLEANKPITLKHKLKTTESVRVKATNSAGKAIGGKTNVIDENTVEFIPSKTEKNVTIEVSGKVEDKDAWWLIATDQFTYTAMSVKNITLTYSETNGSSLAGYNPMTKFVGTEYLNDFAAPGIPYIMGVPDNDFGSLFHPGWEETDFAHWATNEMRWVTEDSLVNQPFMLSHNNSLNLRANLEPIKSMRIDVTAMRSINKSMTEFYSPVKNPYYEASNPDLHPYYIFEPNNKQYTGSFNMSFNAIRTAFKETDDANEYASEPYENFLKYRETIAIRLAEERKMQSYDMRQPNILPANDSLLNNYPNGYSPFSQEVLRNAFIAAYSGRSPNETNLAIFPLIPALNWNVRYSGLSNIGFIKKYIKTIKLNHSYKSTYSVGNYQTNPRVFIEEDGFNYIRNELDSVFFIPEYEFSAVNISERFNPLFGIDMAFKNSMTAKFEIRKSRTLSLSFANNQITESMTNDIVIGAGYIIRQVPIRVKVGGEPQKFESDLNLRADLSIRNMVSLIRNIQEQQNQLTAGQKNITLKLTADYVLSERFNIRLFYDQVINNPKLSTSFRTSNIKFGVSVRFTLIP